MTAGKPWRNSSAQTRFCKSCVRVKKRSGKFCRVFATATTPFSIFIQFLSPNHRPQAFCLFFFGGGDSSLPSQGLSLKTKKPSGGPESPKGKVRVKFASYCCPFLQFPQKNGMHFNFSFLASLSFLCHCPCHLGSRWVATSRSLTFRSWGVYGVDLLVFPGQPRPY